MGREEYLPLVWLISTELKTHLGMKFIIDLTEKNDTFATFKKILIKIGPELSDSFMADLLINIQHMASTERMSKSLSKQDELAPKFRAEVKDEDIVNDVMTSLEAFASSNKKQSANVEGRDRRRHKSRSQDRKERRLHRSRTCSRSQTRHRSRDRGRVSAEIRCQEKLKKKNAAMESSSRVMLYEEDINGLILCGKYLPNEMLMGIFYHTDCETLLSCQLVCKHWSMLVRKLGESKSGQEKMIKEVLGRCLFEYKYRSSFDWNKLCIYTLEYHCWRWGPTVWSLYPWVR